MTAAVFTGTSGAAGPPATGDNWVEAFVPNPSLYDGETVTASVYLRVASGTQNVNLYLDNSGDQGSPAPPTFTAKVTTTWQRFDLTGLLQNGLTAAAFQIGGGNSLPYGTSIQIWGAQFVIGSDPAPYTPTSTTTTVGQSGTPVATGLYQLYSYDSFGNILQNGSFQTSYPANNQIFEDAYDFAGNLVSDGMNIMTWDAESRMATVSGATYIYDAEGNRVEKQGSAVVDTVYFGGKPIARYSSGQWTDLVYGPTGLLAEVPGTQTGSPVYRVIDNLGTNVGSLLANGTFVNPVDHTPFGQVFTGNTSDPYLFTGKERDTESGLDYFGARYYGSSMGRFMSPDDFGGHLEDPQTLNKYSYVGNNPLSRTDPSGHDFYQSCDKASATCGNQNIGTKDNPVNHLVLGTTDSNGKFSAGIVTSASLSDPTSGNSAVVNGTGVQVTSGAGTAQGIFINGTPSADIKGQGAGFDQFSFHIDSNYAQRGVLAAGTANYLGSGGKQGMIDTINSIRVNGNGPFRYSEESTRFGNPFHPGEDNFRFSTGSDPEHNNYGPSPHFAVPRGPGDSGDFHVDSKTGPVHLPCALVGVGCY